MPMLFKNSIVPYFTRDSIDIKKNTNHNIKYIA